MLAAVGLVIRVLAGAAIVEAVAISSFGVLLGTLIAGLAALVIVPVVFALRRWEGTAACAAQLVQGAQRGFIERDVVRGGPPARLGLARDEDLVRTIQRAALLTQSTNPGSSVR